MIISDAHRFAFVHIPKCAGSSLRQQLAHLDSYGGAFSAPGEHPNLGPVHYAHLPMADLQSWFPDQFEKVCHYESFAVVREPHTRFVSAVLQNLNEFSHVGPEMFSKRFVISEIFSVVTRLRAGTVERDAKLVHFIPQNRFVSLDGNRVVRNLFRMNDLHRLAESMQAKCGITIRESYRSNERQVADSRPIGALKRIAGPAYQRMLTPSVRANVRRALWKMRLNYSAEQLYEDVMDDGKVRRFVESYYAEDIALYRSL